MGLMRFVADDQSLVTESRLARAYVAGPDETPTYGRTIQSGEHIVVERPGDSSGNFSIPWPLPGRGDWLLSTSSLMEREKPYHLEVELARGLVFRLRDQLAAWESLGLSTREDILQGVAKATQDFSRAAVSQATDPKGAAEHAREALDTAADASCRLADVYAEQALALRMANDQRLSTLLGIRLSGKAPGSEKAKRLASTFNLANIACGWGAVEPSEGRRDWSQSDKPVEWARNEGMRVCIGPLLEFDDKLLPDWAYLFEGDVEMLTSLMIGHVRAAVQRYRGKAQLWHVGSKINRDKILSLSDEQRLQIIASAVRVIRQLDPSTPVVVGIDQPWGEYRATRPGDLTPLDFADALERADLGIAGFELELNIGYHPFGTEFRNPLALSRLVDLWNVRLDSPLMLSVNFPANADKDSAADTRLAVVAGGTQPDILDPAFQADWARRRLPMLIAKNAVQVIIWGQASDRHPHTYPNSGLYDAENQERPVMGVLQDLRSRLLA